MKFCCNFLTYASLIALHSNVLPKINAHEVDQIGLESSGTSTNKKATAKLSSGFILEENSSFPFFSIISRMKHINT